ncbi:MAG TPA: ABC transporter permease, partial [Gaiellaceae bacterium]|nr:ABC transporter permease [Gaiellaceae bacterium]
MRRVTLRGMLGRKLRTALTALAIVLGVAMVSGSLVLTDTIQKAFDSIFSSSYEDTDAVVSGVKLVEWSQTGAVTVSPQLLERIRALPQVERAAGTILDVSGDGNQAKILDKQGHAISGSNPTFGLGIDPHDVRFSPFTLVEGTWASGPGQVVIDRGTASSEGFRLGDRIGIAGEGPLRRYTLTGIVRFGDVDSLGGATIAVFDVATARTVLHKDGYDAIAVAAKPGVSRPELISGIERILPATAEVRTPEQQAAKDAEDVGGFVTAIRWILVGFGAVALFVGAFVIFNTLSITVAQRTRELATLRTLGASRRQILRSVVLEGLVVGLIASVVGLGLGVGLALGLTELMAAIDLDMPRTGTVFATRTAIVAVLAGTLITLAASLIPALRATRIQPIAAVREGGLVVKPLSRRALVAALTVLTLSVAALGYGMLGSGVSTAARILGIAFGSLGLFVGTAMLAPRLVRPLAS